MALFGEKMAFSVKKWPFLVKRGRPPAGRPSAGYFLATWVPYTHFDGLDVAIPNMSEKKIFFCTSYETLLGGSKSNLAKIFPKKWHFHWNCHFFIGNAISPEKSAIFSPKNAIFALKMAIFALKLHHPKNQLSKGDALGVRPGCRLLCSSLRTPDSGLRAQEATAWAHTKGVALGQLVFGVVQF